MVKDALWECLASCAGPQVSGESCVSEEGKGGEEGAESEGGATGRRKGERPCVYMYFYWCSNTAHVQYTAVLICTKGLIDREVGLHNEYGCAHNLQLFKHVTSTPV